MILGYIGPNFGGNKNLFNPKKYNGFFKTDLNVIGTERGKNE